MYAKFIPISAVEPFVLFPFTRDYLNLEMFKIFYLLGVYVKNVYFCMIFTFVFFFERSIQISIKIPTDSIQDKEIEYSTFSYLHGSWLLILWLHCGFCNKKGNIWDFNRILPSLKESSGRNMTVRLDNRHPPLPKTGWENEDLILILRKKMEFFADSRYKCFQC